MAFAIHPMGLLMEKIRSVLVVSDRTTRGSARRHVLTLYNPGCRTERASATFVQSLLNDLFSSVMPRGGAAIHSHCEAGSACESYLE